MAFIFSKYGFSGIARSCSFLIFGFLVFTSPLSANDFTWLNVAGDVAKALDEAVAAKKTDDIKTAKRALTKAYFGIFESRKMEAAMRKTMGQTHTFEVERMFSGLRGMIGNETIEKVSETATKLIEQLYKDAKVLDAEGVSEEVYDVR